MAGKVRYLSHHRGRYYARMRVPEGLQKALKKTELWEALDADRRTAIALLPQVVARMQASLDAAHMEAAPEILARPRPRRLLTDRQIAFAHYQRELTLDTMARDAGPHLEGNVPPSEWTKLFAEPLRKALKRVASGEAPNDETQAVIGWAIDDLTSNENVKVEFGSPEWRSLARMLASVRIETLDRVKERNDGDFSGQPKLPILGKEAESTSGNSSLEARNLGPDSALLLVDLLPKFFAERKMTSSSQSEQAVSVRMFDEFLTTPKPVYQITRRDIIGYKNALLEAPAHYVKRFPKLTLPAAISANKQLKAPYPTLDPRTVNDKWLSNMRSLLNWCVQNDIIPDNPAHGIKVTTTKEKEPKRIPFDPGDLQKIFSTTLFAKRAAWGERQWSYIMMLYCGTRPSELAQVQLDSVRHERGILVMRVQEETKNINSQRVIPLHSKLLELGLEKRIAALRKAGQTHLFPEWYEMGQEAKRKADAKAKATGKARTLDQFYPKFIPRNFNESYRWSVGISDDRKDFYSFRHTFKTGLRLAGVSKEIRDDFCGHKNNSAGSVYEHGTSVEAMRDALEKLQYDGFPL